MDAIIQIFFAPMQPFVWNPVRAYLMAGGFAILLAVTILCAGGFKPRIHILILAATLLWLFFGLNEYQAKQKGWDIRVDLLLFWPILLVVSIASVWRGLRSIVAWKSKDGNANNGPNRTVDPQGGSTSS